jgi:ubiquinone/menaquinone biosynthesis C-methylase UbiE
MIDALAYRIAARALFAPFGGLATMRRRAVDGLGIHPGSRVLELGCGPGELTVALLARGAVVDAVDASETMLRAARSRASGASYTRADVLSYALTERYAGILLAFVLHELPVSEIPRLLARLAGGLENGGRLVILDHAVPADGGRSLWRRILHGIETPAVDAWLAFQPAPALQDAGLRIIGDEPLAGGRARLSIAVRR